MVYENSLYHHGILGQKWGVRRFQNPDGSLTDAGKRREAKMTKRQIKKDRKQAAKDRSLLSDAELNSRIQRLQKEKQLRELTDQEIRRGKKYAGDMIQNNGKQVMQKILVEGAAGLAVALGTKYIKDYVSTGKGFGNGFVKL